MTTQAPANRPGSGGPVDHAQAREWMSARHDGELSPADARAFDAHLAACRECKAEYETMRRAIVEVSGLRSMPVRPRGSLLPSIQRTIRQRSRGKFFADGWSL